MMDEEELNFTIEYAFRFGQVAIKKGFITEQQLEDALDEQITQDLTDNHHKLIGEILLIKGLMTQNQIAMVLEELVKNKKKFLKLPKILS